MKKMILSIVIALTFIMSACSQKAPAQPEQDAIKDDIQEYIVGVRDENAAIKYFTVESDNTESNGQYVAACIVSYQSDEAKYVDRFQVSYSVKDGGWVLKSISIDEAYSDKIEERVMNEGEKSTKSTQGDGSIQETTTQEVKTDKIENITDKETTLDESIFDVVIDAERGYIDENNVYTNEAFGISFQIPFFCTIFNDEEIVQLVGLDGVIFDENGEYSIDSYEYLNGGSFCDVWFCYPDGYSNVYVNYGNLLLSGLYLYNESYLISELKKGLEDNKELGVVFSEDTTETYGTRTYICANGHSDNGISIKMMVSKINNYIILIAISYLDDTNIADSFLETLTTIE